LVIRYIFNLSKQNLVKKKIIFYRWLRQIIYFYIDTKQSIKKKKVYYFIIIYSLQIIFNYSSKKKEKIKKIYDR
jgi:sensor histidine kinase YesM